MIMAWVEVTEPMTGVTLTVQEDSPQAKAWGESPKQSKPAAGSKKTQD